MAEHQLRTSLGLWFCMTVAKMSFHCIQRLLLRNASPTTLLSSFPCRKSPGQHHCGDSLMPLGIVSNAEDKNSGPREIRKHRWRFRATEIQVDSRKTEEAIPESRAGTELSPYLPIHRCDLPLLPSPPLASSSSNQVTYALQLWRTTAFAVALP